MATETRIGTKIREARERKRWTQEQLADAIGGSVRAVNDWENHRAKPRNISVLEEALGVRLRDDEGGTTTTPAEPAPPDRPLTDEELAGALEEMLRRVRKLPPAGGGGQQDQGGHPPNEHRNRTRTA
jgi:transcriptional regulator with XRE-family HTH domain